MSGTEHKLKRLKTDMCSLLFPLFLHCNGGGWTRWGCQNQCTFPYLLFILSYFLFDYVLFSVPWDSCWSPEFLPGHFYVFLCRFSFMSKFPVSLSPVSNQSRRFNFPFTSVPYSSFWSPYSAAVFYWLSHHKRWPPTCSLCLFSAWPLDLKLRCHVSSVVCVF